MSKIGAWGQWNQEFYKELTEETRIERCGMPLAEVLSAGPHAVLFQLQHATSLNLAVACKDAKHEPLIY